MKIVVAEDDPGSRRTLKRVLAATGFEVVVLEDGLAAWDHIEAQRASLLITDWVMPRVDGLDLCRRIRARASDSPYIYIIMMTGLDRREDRLEALRAGADDFLAKPVDRAELLARINVARRIIEMEGQLRCRSAELERHNSLLSEMATSDGLTSLKNHRYFRETLEAHLSLSRRQVMPLSLIMIDVDQFKAFNDGFGHPAGDDVLREVAGLLRASVRDHDVVARYGGEEFAVLLPATDAEAALALGERLRLAVQAHDWPLRAITISLGIATSAPGGATPVEMIMEADRSLYRSKADGRNRVTHARSLPGPLLDPPGRPILTDGAGIEDLAIVPFLS